MMLSKNQVIDIFNKHGGTDLIAEEYNYVTVTIPQAIAIATDLISAYVSTQNVGMCAGMIEDEL